MVGWQDNAILPTEYSIVTGRIIMDNREVQNAPVSVGSGLFAVIGFRLSVPCLHRV